jgi:hypothetical protein
LSRLSLRQVAICGKEGQRKGIQNQQKLGATSYNKQGIEPGLLFHGKLEESFTFSETYVVNPSYFTSQILEVK